MKKTYKTLIFKDAKDRNKLGWYPRFVGGEFYGGCNIPELMGIRTTMKDLKMLYPKQNFDTVKLVIITTQTIESKQN